LSSINAWIHGKSGRMGIAISKVLQETPEDFCLVGGSTSSKIEFADQRSVRAFSEQEFLTCLNKVDLVWDFSSPEGNRLLLQAVSRPNFGGKSFLIGTTGLNNDQLLAWSQSAKTYGLRVLFAPNTSIGILAFRHVLKQVAPLFLRQDFDCEIVESHHRNKLDSPSGTALTLAAAVQSAAEGFRAVYGRTGHRQKSEIGISSLRGGSVIGEHEVQFLGAIEEFKLSHRALDRQVFAKGALTLGRWIQNQSNGVYSLDDISLTDL
jgi:4-hydroxy-tetrahydrodipicolinate reductase